MKRSLLAAAVLWWIAPPPATAHRLDELLQATTIALAEDHVVVQTRLTPGVVVAAAVLADIDLDGDAVLSRAEQQAYTERVRHDLSLTVNGERLPLRSTSATFPSVEEIKEGIGEILITFRADMPPGAQNHRLIFENDHRSQPSAYLVNCLLPDDPRLCVTAQNRNYEQSFDQLDYTRTAAIPRRVSIPARSRLRGGPLAGAALVILASSYVLVRWGQNRHASKSPKTA